MKRKRTITGVDREKVSRRRRQTVAALKPAATPRGPRERRPRPQLPSDSQQQAAQEREGKGSGGARRRITTTKPDSPEAAWREAELLALQQSVTLEHQASKALPLIAICGRPNVGKSTLFNRLTGSRRSIVGDEPGITRDRIYGEIEWAGRDVRLVDTGGVVPDDEALIPSEIFRQAQVALEEADAIVMVVDGRTELAIARHGAGAPAHARRQTRLPRRQQDRHAERCIRLPKTSGASASAMSS